ncbi:MAG: stage II sporulation protein M, partial [Acidimicrobiales bacterium]
VWLGVSDRAIDSIADDAAQQAYVTEDFEAYYSSAPAAQFSTEVLVNNIQVSFLAFAAGIFFCVGTAYILAFNGANLGIAAGLFSNVGSSAVFWGLILPHGLLELSAVVVSGAAGLRLGWAIIAPGDQTRVQALAGEGRRSVIIILGLAVVFVFAGLIEGFVTPSSLSTPVRVGIGILAELAFVLYIVSRGRLAASHGLTGMWGERIHAAAADPDAYRRPVALIPR